MLRSTVQTPCWAPRPRKSWPWCCMNSSPTPPNTARSPPRPDACGRAGGGGLTGRRLRAERPPHGRLLVEWQEIGGPRVRACNQAGYGTSVIRELLPYELGGQVELLFAPDGVRCCLEIPAEWVGAGQPYSPIAALAT